MAKIAALVLPSSRAAELDLLCKAMQDMLCLCSHHRVEADTYRGEQAVCTLLRVKPDLLNPEAQPARIAEMACVACGYYFSPTGGHTSGSAGRLGADLISEDGLGTLVRGDGVYAFACWDRRRERLIAGVDKLGMRPLYWVAVPGGGYAVASELKALIALARRLEINWAAWEEHLTFGYVFGQHTFFAGMYRFGPAQVITFRHDDHISRTVEQFLENIEVQDRPVNDFLDEQGEVFDAAMARLAALYDAPGHTMLTLTGGYDSRRILGWLLNHDIRPEVYTVPEVLSDGHEFESTIVRDLCYITGISGHTVYPVTAADRAPLRALRDLAIDFESDEHTFSVILAMGLDCDDKVNFDGLAAGSQLSGSFMIPDYFEPGGDEKFVAHWPRPVSRWLRLPPVDAPPLRDRVRAELDRWGDNPNRFSYFYLMGRTRREVSLAPLAIQANVFESLCPYLDRNMMRNAFSFPPARKVGAHLQMPLIAALHPPLGRVRTAYMLESRHGLTRPHLVNSHRINGVERYDERKALLKNIGRLPASNPAWASSITQKWRFQLASLLAPFLTDRQLTWEFAKATKLAQLTHFGQASRTPADYEQAVSALKTALGSRPDWCRRL